MSSTPIKLKRRVCVLEQSSVTVGERLLLQVMAVKAEVHVNRVAADKIGRRLSPPVCCPRWAHALFSCRWIPFPFKKREGDLETPRRQLVDRVWWTWNAAGDTFSTCLFCLSAELMPPWLKSQNTVHSFELIMCSSEFTWCRAALAVELVMKKMKNE